MALPFADARFDAYTISFGIRNVTRIEDALAEAFRVLRPGGRLMVLEFSRVPEPSLRWLYDRYSFNVIPALGQALAGDRASYQYLVESIRRFPDQETFAGDDRRGRLRPGPLPQPLDGRRRAALGLEALMRGPHNLWRLIRTGATFERTGAMRIALEAFDAPPALRVAARVLGWPFQWLGYEGDPIQPPILRALTALGPGLHQVRPAPLDAPRRRRPRARRAARGAAGQAAALPDGARRAPRSSSNSASPLDAIFADFEPPVAAASLAQVHRATLRDDRPGRSRSRCCGPGIERAFLRDVDAFYFAAGMIELLAPFARRLRPKAVIRHFEGVVQGELDLRMEAAAAAEFAANTARDPGFRVPAVIWPASGRRVLTLEWASGVNMGDLAALRASGIDLVRLSERIIQTFLTHALRDGFFHADMHQGNLKLGPDGALVALDFGIMGRIDAYTRRVYAEILIGFLRSDYQRVAEVHFEAGYVPARPRHRGLRPGAALGRRADLRPGRHPRSRWPACSPISSRSPSASACRPAPS